MPHPWFGLGRNAALVAASLCMTGALLSACSSSTTTSSGEGEVPDGGAVCIEHPDGPQRGDLCVRRNSGVLRVEGSGLEPLSPMVFTGGTGDTLTAGTGPDGTIDIEISAAVATPPYRVTARWNTATSAEFSTGAEVN